MQEFNYPIFTPTSLKDIKNSVTRKEFDRLGIEYEIRKTENNNGYSLFRRYSEIEPLQETESSYKVKCLEE